MSRDKQIEEMAQCLCEYNRGTLCILDDKDCDLQCTYGKLANKLTAKGYRKSTDLAEEIFAEVKQALDISVETEHFKGSWFNMNKFMQSLAELKKKYTKGGKGQDG